MPAFAPAVAGLIGIGVGIDYSLLVLTRFRSALLAGADVREAVVEAVSTAGRSVLVAGATVVISLFGLTFMGVSFLYGVAVSASLAVLVVVAAAVTLLPALLSFAGSASTACASPVSAGRCGTGGGTLATRWSRARAAPRRDRGRGRRGRPAWRSPRRSLGLRYGFPDEGNDPAGHETRARLRARQPRLRAGRKRAAAPRRREAAARSSARSRHAIRARAGCRLRRRAAPEPGRRRRVLTVVPATSPQDGSDDRARRAAPRRAPATASTSAALTAAFVDQSDYVAGRIPLFIGGVVCCRSCCCCSRSARR